MKEHPILFLTEMTRAILDDRKTQTRRIIKPQPEYEDGYSYWWKGDWDTRGGPRAGVCTHGSPGNGEATWTLEEIVEHCPYGEVGDRLWVKEDYKYLIQGDMVITYYKHSLNNNRVDYTPINCLPEITRKKLYKGRQGVWKSKLLMFKFMSRIWPEITNIRVERVQGISEADTKAEGVVIRNIGETWWRAFHNLWDSINAKRGYGWDKNLWVWVVEFTLNVK